MLFRAYNFIIKSIIRSLIIFKKQRKMTNDFFNHYIFVRTFQWTSSECLTNVAITKFDVRSVFWDLSTSKMELSARTVHGWCSQLISQKTPSQKIVDFNYTSVLCQLNNFNGADGSWTFRVGLSRLICNA